MLESSPLRFVLYFLVGGAVVSLVSLLTGLGRPHLAAFVGLIPSTTLLTFMFTYWEGGAAGTVSYARGMLYFTPAWMLYVGAIILLLPRLGLLKTLAIGVAVFFAAALVTNVFLRSLGVRIQ
ncbi:MAG: DUF3147 domain-containing protein [Chloroflexi bacterium]|nr:DUF3147 domain-containing protein [Chloroflexota bacterium]